MTGLIMEKLFPDIGTPDALAKLINKLGGDDDHAAANRKILELVRKHKDMLEKRPSDMEQFITVIYDSPVSSLPVLAALKSLFDHLTIGKAADQTSSDRIVEMFKSAIDNGKFNGEHLSAAPDMAVPFFRRTAMYCMKRNEAGAALEIASAGLTLLQLFDGETVSSLHSAYLCAAIKLGQFDRAMQAIPSVITSVLNESGTNFDVSEAVRRLRVAGVGACQTPHFPSRFMLSFLYYAALVLIKKNRHTLVLTRVRVGCIQFSFICSKRQSVFKELFKRARIFLEMVIIFPSLTASLIQLDACKKYILVSLLLDTSGNLPKAKSSSLTRLLNDNVGKLYEKLNTTATQTHFDKVAAVQDLLDTNWEKFNKDCNVGLVERLVRHLRTNSVLLVAKTYSSIRMKDLMKKVNMETEEEMIKLIETLQEAGHISCSLEESMDGHIVRWSVPSKIVTAVDLQDRTKRLSDMAIRMQDADLTTSLNPTLVVKEWKGRFSPAHHEDEGLSMSSPFDV